MYYPVMIKFVRNMYVLSASERFLNFTAKHNAVKNTKKSCSCCPVMFSVGTIGSPAEQFAPLVTLGALYLFSALILSKRIFGTSIFNCYKLLLK
jgi:hypothetical protein